MLGVSGTNRSSQPMSTIPELLYNCEIHELVSRMLTAVSDFFKSAANIFLNCYYEIVLTIFDGLGHAHSLITDRMNSEEKRRIIEAVARIPRAEREQVIIQAFQLISNDMDSEERVWAIEAVSGVPRFEREEVIDQAKRLITANMERRERSAVIEAVSRVPRSERAMVIAQARRLIFGLVNGWEIEEIIRIVASAPSNIRRFFVTRVLRVIIEDLDNLRMGQNIIQTLEYFRGVFARSTPSVVF